MGNNDDQLTTTKPNTVTTNDLEIRGCDAKRKAHHNTKEATRSATTAADERTTYSTGLKSKRTNLQNATNDWRKNAANKRTKKTKPATLQRHELDLKTADLRCHRMEK